MWSLLSYVGAIVIVCLSYWMYQWSKPWKGCRLPPGSMGIPLPGETLSFLSSSSSTRITPFFQKRITRYGSIFKTNLFGRLVIVSTDPDFSYFIFQQEGRLFQLWYPGSFTEMFGSQADMFYGSVYKLLKSLVMCVFGSETIKKNVIPDMEQTCCNGLKSWTEQDGGIEFMETLRIMMFEMSAKKSISYDPAKHPTELGSYFLNFLQGNMSFPLNIPGTSFYKAMQSHKNALKVLKDMLDQRRLAGTVEGRTEDVMDLFLKETKKEGSVLTEAFAINVLFLLIFASFETTTLSLTFIMKLLTEHPPVVEQLREEHDSIAKEMSTNGSGISWEIYKSMTFTAQVIQESLRLSNMNPGLFRRATTDVHIKGYTIPAGSMVMVYTPALHLDPLSYPDPLAFKPERWEGQDMRSGSKHFMVFGGGSRLCVGAEFSKLFTSIFLHHLVTKYSWKAVKGGDVLWKPFVTFPNGFRVQLFERKREELQHTDDDLTMVTLSLPVDASRSRREKRFARSFSFSRNAK